LLRIENLWFLEDRIHITKDKGQLSISIKAFKENAKQKLLLVWMVLFSLCGLAIISQFFGDYDRNTKVFFGIYLVFWLFFEFKVIYAYCWRKNGEERIIIDENKLIIIKEIGERGVTQRFQLDNVKNLKLFESDQNKMIQSLTTSYWNINKFSLAFDYHKKMIPFAIDLIPKNAKYILKELKKVIDERTLE